MNKGDQREIMILMSRFSMIVKAIERRLAELDFKVSNVSEHLQEHVERYGGRVALFIMYLPADIAEDSATRSMFFRLCSLADEKNQKVILIGEQRSYDDLMSHHPSMRQYMWINRPVNIEDLEKRIFSILDGEEAGNDSKQESAGEVATSGKQKRILVVDDDPSYAKMVRLWIKDKYRVDIVTAGMQAISFLLRQGGEQVDLILLDYEMPVVDGPQVLQMLRQEEATSHIPVIFLTGVGTKEAVSRVMELHPDGYLLKTTSRENLLAFLQKKLG